MRVCIVTTSYPSYLGDARGKMPHDTALHMVRRGVTVDVVAPVNPDTKTGTVDLNGVSVHRFGYPFCGSRFDPRRPGDGGMPYRLTRSWGAKLALPFFLLALMAATLSHARKADLIHAQWLPNALLALLLKPFHRRPILVTVRGSDLPWVSNKRLVTRVVRALASGIDHFIAVSDKYAQELHTILDIPREKISYVQNGIDTTEFTPAASKERTRGDLGFPANKLCLLYVGNVIEEKGVFHLLDAWLATHRNGQDPHLVVIGEGSAAEALAARVAASGLTNRVWLLGKQSNEAVADWMRAADMFVFPTMHPEGVAQVVKEAMASALPIITTPAGGIPEVVTDGVTGFLVPQGDSAALAERIIELLGDPERRRVMGRQARDWIANSDLSIENSAQKVMSIYDRIVPTASDTAA